MDSFKAIIIDDNLAIRTELKFLLINYPIIKVVGEAANINQALGLIEKIQPDVIFLDIQLKNEIGFELFEKTDITSKVIFITAFDQYAIRAFEVNALDYLMKPINKDKLEHAINKLHESEYIKPSKRHKLSYNDVVYLMINRSLKFVKVSSLHCIMAEGKYSYIIYGDVKKVLVSKTLLEWEEILPEKYFVRIHRSTIVNFEYVINVKRCKNNTHEVFVAGIKEPFIMSRRHATKLKKVLSW